MIRRHFMNLRLATKLGLLVGLACMALVAVAWLGAVEERSALYDGKEATTRHLVESAVSLVDSFHQRSARGEIGVAEAQAQALAALRTIRYGNNDYLWVNDLSMRMLMHPMKPELEGKSSGETVDGNGVYMFREMVAIVEKQGAGFVKYAWPRPGASAAAPKLSYVAGFKPWGWVVGTGIYTDDVADEFAAKLRISAIWVALLGSGFALVAFVITRTITRPLSAAVALAEAVSAGRLDVDIEAAAKDETGRLAAALMEMVVNLRSVIGAQKALAEHHAQGDTSYRIDAGGLRGAYLDLAGLSNQLVGDHLQVQEELARVIGDYSDGDFTPDMPQLPGERARFTTAMGKVKHNLSAMKHDILRLSEAAAAGDFSVRGDAARFNHSFRDMVAALNGLMDQAHSGLADVGQVLEALADGDLGRRIERNYRGAFGQLASDANRTSAQLSQVMRGIEQSSGSVRVAAAEIAAGNVDLSARTEAQAANLQETASSMEELTSAVRHNAEAAHRARSMSQAASEEVRKGGRLVAEVVGTMAEISSSAHRITDIIGVIDGIAFQTNILALNAAVEAARAGEQGRGFAVVASEVRQLAQRSALAAREIKTLIQASGTSIALGRERVDATGVAMRDIVERIDAVSALMNDIAAASDEQAKGIEQVNAAVDNMDKGTQQNAALVEEAASAAQSMADQAGELSQLVQKFRFASDEDRAPTPAPDVQEAGASSGTPPPRLRASASA